MAGPAGATAAAAVAAAAAARFPSSYFSSKSILLKSITIFFSSFPSLLLLSLLLLSLRSALLAGTLTLAALPDTDPLLRSLLSRLSSPPSSSSSPRFFHLSPALPLAEDFFSSPPPPPPPLSLNSTAVSILGIRPIIFSLADSENSSLEEANRAARGFSLGADGIRIIHLVSILSSAHAAAILGFVLCYSVGFGVVFYCVACDMVCRDAPSLIDALRFGARLGVRRLVGLVFLKWAVRDAVVQILCIWFFANVEDQNKLFKLFIKVKLMPFSLTVLSGELPGFLLVWGVLDFVLSVFLVLLPWIVVVDDVRRTGREVVKEGIFLVSLVSRQFMWIKCLEMVVSGRLGRLVLAGFAGRRFAMWAQAILEVYFMVVWLVLYLEARRKDCELGGRRFGREELERCIDRL